MSHPVTYDELLMLANDVLPSARLASVEAHLLGCTACQEQLETFARLDRTLREEAMRLRSESKNADVAGLVAATMRRLQNEAPGMDSAKAMSYLCQILMPICGKYLIEQIIRTAAAGLPKGVRWERAEWETFTQRLGLILSSVCGLSVAAAMKHASRLAVIEGA
jgi:hypothetical protein